MIDLIPDERYQGRPFTGLPCPQCQALKSYVIDTRSWRDGRARRRRYECNSCQFRFTTYEVRAEEYERVNGARR